MTDRELTRRRVLALGGAAVGAALGIGLNSCTAEPGPDTSPGPGESTTPAPPADGPVREPATDAANGP
ncbi:twin-arginine translocation signal domain-containing protein [Streptomyces sp. NPDC007084]|uniref:twin-arginine translocation signal domain-containing protein n=1 Tax=Streptomyces sp. NPDC007084 TaxID=3154313 RepID=UPI0034516F8B